MSGIEAISQKPTERALAVTDDRQLAVRTATDLWAEATTASTTQRREEVIHDKVAAVRDFFDLTGKMPGRSRQRTCKLGASTWRAGGRKRGNDCSRRPFTRESLASHPSTLG